MSTSDLINISVDQLIIDPWLCAVLFADNCWSTIRDRPVLSSTCIVWAPRLKTDLWLRREVLHLKGVLCGRGAIWCPFVLAWDHRLTPAWLNVKPQTLGVSNHWHMWYKVSFKTVNHRTVCQDRADYWSFDSEPNFIFRSWWWDSGTNSLLFRFVHQYQTFFQLLHAGHIWRNLQLYHEVFIIQRIHRMKSVWLPSLWYIICWWPFKLLRFRWSFHGGDCPLVVTISNYSRCGTLMVNTRWKYYLENNDYSLTSALN